MQMMSLMIFTVIGMALFAALSLTLYQALPRSVLESGARHGRFADFGTGLRMSELFALKWKDIDFGRTEMSVTRSIVTGGRSLQNRSLPEAGAP